MKRNLVTLIAGFLLISPIVLGLLRGLPRQIEITRFKLQSFIYSAQWLLAYLAAPVVLRLVIIQNPWRISLFNNIAKEIERSFFIWAISVPIVAMLIMWLLNIILEPFEFTIAEILYGMQIRAKHLSPTMSSMSAAVSQIPKGLLNMLTFLLIIHLALIAGQFHGLSHLANQSSIYQWANNQLISPLLQQILPNNSSWLKSYSASKIV